MSKKPHKPHDRRTVFRYGLRKLMDPLVDYVAERFNVTLPIARVVLRPPGALPEREFLQTCYRCGNCVSVCPARAIRPLAGKDAPQTGTPYIDPDLCACVACDELACMKACPSGALKIVSRIEDIHIGLARINSTLCLRGQGRECTVCLSKCPLGRAALIIGEDGHISVVMGGCVGCGTCQFYCPTVPKAIVVDPM